MNIKKIKVMTSEESCDFKVDDKEIEIVKDFLFLDPIIYSKEIFNKKSEGD